MAMRRGLSGLLLLLILITFCQEGFGSDISLTVDPKHYNSRDHQKLNITCTAPSPAFSKKNVLTLQIGKEGSKPIVAYNRQKIMETSNMADNMKAEGFIDKNDQQNHYIRLTIIKPKPSDQGTYSCSVFYLNQLFEIKEDVAKINVTIELDDIESKFSSLELKVTQLEKMVQSQGDVITDHKLTIQSQAEELKRHADKDQTIEDMLQSLVSRFSPFESTIQEQSQKISQLQQTVQEQAQLMTKGDNTATSKIQEMIRTQHNNSELVRQLVSSVVTRINKLEIQGNTCSKQINTLKEQGSFVTAFSAGYDKKDTFQDGDIIRFTDAIFDIGHAYNSLTGKFTAPKKGLYVFTLFITILEKRFIHINLEANSRVIATLYAYDDKYSDQSSVSTVVSLNVGDQVWPSVKFIGQGHTVYYDDHYSVFSGYLLQLMSD